MAWTYLALAGCFEIAWAVGLKYTVGLTRPWPTIGTVAAMLASFWFLALAARSLPIGTAYAVWTGVGVIGTTVLGVILFNEPRDWQRAFFVSMILVGIIGLKLAGVPAPT